MHPILQTSRLLSLDPNFTFEYQEPTKTIIALLGNPIPPIKVEKSFSFPGGESNVQIGMPGERDFMNGNITIAHRIKNGDDLMKVFLATDAVRRAHKPNKLFLYLPYLPYARQDRVMVPGEALSLKVLGNLINSQGYDLVFTHDVHSDVAETCIDNLININNTGLVWYVLNKLKMQKGIDKPLLISPDAGALKKIYKTAKAVGYEDENIVTGTKIRNVKTGEIVKMGIDQPELVAGRDCIIVDDICDGGRTFTELTAILKNNKAKTVTLIVTHGIFSKGEQPLKEAGIDYVFTTNSYRDCGSEYVDCVKLLSY